MKFSSSLISAMAAILLIPAVTLAPVIYFLEDGIDNLDVVSKLQKSDIPEDLNSFMGKSISIAENLTDDELVSNFGAPIKRPKNSHVFSVALLERGRGFGGGSFVQMETKFYRVGKLGGIERHTAYYSGGSTVSNTFVLLRIDDNFPKGLDSKEKLDARIAWERSRWPDLVVSLQNIRRKTIVAPAKNAHIVHYHFAAEGSLRIVYSDGTEVEIPKEKGRFNVAQGNFSGVEIADDGQHIGWLGEYMICARSYPCTPELAIYRSGHKLTYISPPHGVVWDWHFLKRGKQISLRYGFPNGDDTGKAKLYDSETGRDLGETPLPSEKAVN
jgi:hypothetical protein